MVLGTVHFAHWETQTWYPFLSSVPLPEFGVIFRPLDNPSADAFVKRTRERFGMKLLSRKQGLHLFPWRRSLGELTISDFRSQISDQFSI